MGPPASRGIARVPRYSGIPSEVAAAVAWLCAPDSGAITGSWAGKQRREADEIALALLGRTGRSATRVAESLAEGLKKVRLPEGDWAARYVESTERVMLLASLTPR